MHRAGQCSYANFFPKYNYIVSAMFGFHNLQCSRSPLEDDIPFCVTHLSRSSSLGASTTPERASCDLNRENTFCADCTGCLNTSIRENLDVSRTSEGLPAIKYANCYTCL
jgi:hypothetical protein